MKDMRIAVCSRSLWWLLTYERVALPVGLGGMVGVISIWTVSTWPLWLKFVWTAMFLLITVIGLWRPNHRREGIVFSTTIFMRGHVPDDIARLLNDRTRIR